MTTIGQVSRATLTPRGGLQARGLQDVKAKDALRAAGETVDERTDAIVNTIEFKTKAECITAITTLWERSQRNFVAIGKYLIRAKEKLAHGEYGKMIESELPFNRSLAYMMRTIAEAIESRKISQDECPTDYATAYRLISLPPDKFQLAREKSLVKPNLRRYEIIDFRRQFLEPPKMESKEPKSTKARQARKNKLLAKIAEFERETARMKAEVIELCKRLGEHDPFAPIIDLEAASYTEVAVDGPKTV